MCGIAAIYSYHYAASGVDREELRRINAHLASRGPDGNGEWFSNDGQVGLAHRRLAIIDLSERASQPMCSEDSNSVITFNGEIYNYKALRSELEDMGRIFRSDSDTEVLLHLYAEMGERMLEKLRGMFAFVLWDAQRNTMFLARDPYGIKPLYYADDGWSVRIASQVKALLAGGKVSRDPEPAGIAGFFLLGSVPEPFTRYQEIRALPAGSYAWVDRVGCHRPRKYFSVSRSWEAASDRPEKLSPNALSEYAREVFADSVRHHLVSDVPVGVFLSAGVDSGALTGLACELNQAHVQSVTLAFANFRGTPNDEAPIAEDVARYYGTNHGTRMVDETEFREDIPRLLAAMDQPSIDGVNSWFASKAARERGLKVVISGLGGDELLGSYPSFRDIPRWVRWLKAPSRIPGLGDLSRGVYALLFVASRTSLSPKAAGLVKYGGTYAGAYLLRRGLFMPWELKSLMGREMAREGLRRLRPINYIEGMLAPDPCTPFGRVAALEASLYLRNQLLRDTDWASMAHSLEVRTPLVDAKLLKSLAPHLVNGETDAKRLLADSVRPELPPKIVDRSKTGFSVPVGEWMQRLSDLDAWKRLPMLSRENCHWARRLAYVLQEPDLV